MSLPNSPGILNTSDSLLAHNRGNKQKLRSVRLEIPFRDQPKPSPNIQSPQTQASPSSHSFGELSISVPAPRHKSKQSMVPQNIGNLSIISPNVFYQFSERTEPTFVNEIVIPENAFAFTAHPGPELVSPRFLIYTLSSTAISTTPIKLIINGRKVEHWMSDPMPIDATDFLVPFGQQNWLIVETGTLVIPFVVVGVWCSRFSFNDIVSTISRKETFPFSEIGALCPITGRMISIPARGVNCMHQQCFDLLSYITTRQAIGLWSCPICMGLCSLDDLRIGEQVNTFPVFVKNQTDQTEQVEVPTFFEQPTQWEDRTQDVDQQTEQYNDMDPALFWNPE